MYSNMYQVCTYVGENFTLIGIFKNSRIDILFYEVVIRSTKLSALKKTNNSVEPLMAEQSRGRNQNNP